MSAQIKGLEAAGLVERAAPNPEDRRRVGLAATEKGRAVLARAKKLVATKHEARLNELLGPANRAALLSMLTKVAQEF